MKKVIPFLLVIFLLVLIIGCKDKTETQSGEQSLESNEQSSEQEESGQQYALNETYDEVRKGVRLILTYDEASSSFVGTVENVTDSTIKSVRVETHLSNGTELGPTESIDLESGKKADVKLLAEGQSFEWWKAHAESGSSEHSHGEQGEHEHGEHGDH